MTAPVVKLYNSIDTTEYTSSSGVDFGDVDPGDTSTPQELHLWNNKGGAADVAEMEYVRIGAVTKNGYTSGDTIANGKEVVEGLYTQIESITNEETSYTAIGGVTTKTLANIKGSKIAAPTAPEGTGTTDVNGHVEEDDYYYVVSALDETGETLQSTESSAVTVGSGQNAVNLTWTAVTGATSYKVFRTTSSGSYGGSSYLGTAATNSYKDLLAVPITGAPLGAATVTYQHKHDFYAQVAVPTSATSGSVEYRLRILYRYTA